MNVAIVGGHGNVSLRLARRLASRANTKVFSIVRNSAHNDDVTAAGATPVELSLEDSPKEKFAEVFTGKDLVYFAAGSGGKGGAERMRKVDFEGAVKVFDALELVPEPRPRLILVSSVDVRDYNKRPPHYTDADVKKSEEYQKALGGYFEAKHQADLDLVRRAAFKWTILRPALYTNDEGTGLVQVGKTHLDGTISRDDVAQGWCKSARRTWTARSPAMMSHMHSHCSQIAQTQLG
ncbi:NADH(P)-binding-domain-containing protein [Phanerochaete sordida]|uniref:NADH(P)-binding-domain-containing protein n=1 Tax=Phanerochaete sordida TaxID=48140 RepID=A0A9P3GHR5_9APHY|nr:NADH(P)-binding-domain-containing protein [Phanerochaete sordida]